MAQGLRGEPGRRDVGIQSDLDERRGKNRRRIGRPAPYARTQGATAIGRYDVAGVQMDVTPNGRDAVARAVPCDPAAVRSNPG